MRVAWSTVALATMVVVVEEEGDTELALVKDAQVVVAVHAVADMVTVLSTATITSMTTVRTSTVLASTPTSELIRQATAPDRTTSGDEEDGTAAMVVADGTAGIDRVATISDIIHNGISGCRHKVRSSSMCR